MSSQQQHSFIKETVEPGVPPAVTTSTPEPSRRYVQWKEDDVGLLLSDLEQPGHYSKWKENKSGFSKRVAEQVFKNVMYHEAIKFKVRWLESRFKLWNQQLTSPEVEHDESAINNIREKMFKEFPYYDRCKPIFNNYQTNSTSLSPLIDSPAVVQQQQQPNLAPVAATASATSVGHKLVGDESTIMKAEPTHMTNEPSTPTLITPSSSQQQQQEQQQRSPFTDNSNNKRHLDSATSTYPPIKKRATTNTHTKVAAIRPNTSNNDISSCIYRITDGITDERKVKMMELELELKKMDHQERMQEMKLEQLRLEIELQKLKRDTPISLTPIIASSSD